MNFKKIIVTALVLFSFGYTMKAQETVTDEEEKLSLNSGSIDSQFEFVTEKSNSYQNYKVVKKDWLQTLRAHTLDSIKVAQDRLDEAREQVQVQKNQIASLKENLANTNTNLEQLKKEKDSMSLFGLLMNKTVYNTVLWTIIAGLLACLLFFIYKFKNSNVVTKEAKLALEETEKEYENHRRVALEREQKVRRQLQDELNKQKKGVH